MKPAPFYKPYLISASLHLLLLLVLALWTVSVRDNSRWYQFEWLSEADLGRLEAAGRPGEPLAEPSTDALPRATEETTTDAAPVIEQPVWDSPDSSTPIANPAASTANISSSLRESALPLGSGSARYSSSLLEGGGDAYFIREVPPNINPLIDDTVIVEFTLSRDGRVNMSSVSVISYRRAEHFRALREAMREWRFGFTGAYEPSKVYRIRCNFSLN